ncbi:MAG TPA: hypothetical protein VG319_10210 [Polyangia bacterium]|jgi:hypothetical protein|nr:hypothetical protein [Polyangia bacterium]
MKLGASLAFTLLFASPRLTSVARAEERRDERQGVHQERHEEQQDQKREVRHDERLPPRAAPPAWRGHPPGGRPPAATYHPAYHPHAVRVLRPRAMRYGEHPWRHWGHGEFARPVYYWDWAIIRSVTCVAEDSYGDQYPVTESTFAGFGLQNMTAVEDDALDRCYEESGGDGSCFLTTCSNY